jgi:Glycosyl transferases group 1
MQCPTVATRVGGLTDSVVDGVTGILVSPADPVDLAQGILRLLRDPKGARALAEAGRARMLARFTLSKTIADLHALYLDLARAPPRHGRAWPGHPRLGNSKDVDARDKRGHDGEKIFPAARAYGNLAFLWRLVVAGVFCCGLALRFLVVDCWLLPSWDQGWRPWRLTSWMVPARIWLYRCYAVLGHLLPSFGLRHRLCASHAMMMIRLRNAGYALSAMPRMWLYRGYALLGRSASFGLRAKLASSRARAVIRLHNGWCGLRAMPRMLVYRGYGVASRGARALGLRRSRPVGTLRSERSL